MAKKMVLGRGLSALLPDTDETTQEEPVDAAPAAPAPRIYQFEDRVRLVGRVTDVEVDRVERNPFQPRTDFDEAALDELAQSIAELGIIQPITVRALGDHRFELISGERRLRAARRAGLQRIPAYVREADTEAMLEMALVENVQREDLNPIEVAIGYQRLIDECGLTHEDLARKLGKNRTTVTNTLRLLRLSPRVQSSLRDRTITAGHARVLIAFEDTEIQNRLLDRIIRQNLSVREVEKLGRSLTVRPQKTPPASAAPAPQTLESLQIEAFTDKLRRTYGTRVAIRHRSDGAGKIELDYFSNDDLERLLDLLLR